MQSCVSVAAAVCVEPCAYMQHAYAQLLMLLLLLLLL
jgi:hypothetical protein